MKDFDYLGKELGVFLEVFWERYKRNMLNCEELFALFLAPAHSQNPAVSTDTHLLISGDKWASQMSAFRYTGA